MSLGASGNAARDENPGALTELLGAIWKIFSDSGRFNHKKPV
jgi:hypothetical protein